LQVPRPCLSLRLQEEAEHLIDGGRVSFRYRDYKDSGATKTTSLEAHHFIRRFLLHTVPKGFVRIRHCGFLCHSKKKESIKRIRATLLCGRTAVTTPVLNSHRPHFCPSCGAQSWVRSEMPAVPRAQAPPTVSHGPCYSTSNS